MWKEQRQGGQGMTIKQKLTFWQKNQILFWVFLFEIALLCGVFFGVGMVVFNITHSDTYKMNCTTITPICEDRSAYYISYIDSNYLIRCPIQPEIVIKDTNIGGWE